MKTKLTLISYSFLLLVLTSCTSSRYQYSNDHHPESVPSLDHIEDAVPRYEPYSRGGNKNYRVRGIDYKVLKNITSFKEKGKASWYGNKFHGHLTSNGERYDMFTMSAAHKNLPLPSYVKVTNTENNKQVIVRVNDRGPFHPGRIIDLSYAAANKLDIIKAGTASVEIELIHVPENQQTNGSDFFNGYFYVQYLVTSSADKAQKLGEYLSQQYQTEYSNVKENNLVRAKLGPLNSEKAAQKLQAQLQGEYPSSFIIQLEKPE